MIKLDYDSITRQEGVLDQAALASPYRFKKGKKNGMLIVFNGWDPYKEYNIDAPQFNRWKDIAGLGYSILYFSQPIIQNYNISHSIGILYSSLMNEKSPILRAIKEVRDKLGFSNDSLIFYGKSSGCSAAYMFSLKFTCSRAILVNPETNPFSHDVSLRNVVRKKLNKELPKSISKLKNSANLIAKTSRQNMLPYVYIYQNNCDLKYLENQTKPLIDIINSALSSGATGGLTVEYCSSSLGHSSEMDTDKLRTVTSMLDAMKYSKNTGNSNKRVVYLRQSSMNVELELKVTRVDTALELSSSNLVISYSDYSSEVIPIDFSDSSGIELILGDKVNNTVITKVELDTDCQPASQAIKIEIEEYILGLDGS